MASSSITLRRFWFFFELPKFGIGWSFQRLIRLPSRSRARAETTAHPTTSPVNLEYLWQPLDLTPRVRLNGAARSCTKEIFSPVDSGRVWYIKFIAEIPPKFVDNQIVSNLPYPLQYQLKFALGRRNKKIKSSRDGEVSELYRVVELKLILAPFWRQRPDCSPTKRGGRFARSGKLTKSTCQ